MNKKMLRKDFFMEIKTSLGRFLSIFFIVAIGVAFFSGIRSSEPDMRISGDSYFDKQKLMDIKVISTLGLTDDDIDALLELDLVERVEPGYSVDALCTVSDSKVALHIMSMQDTMNQVVLEEGRMPVNEGECVVDAAFMESSDYEIGDIISFTSGTDKNLSETLNYTDFRITGIVSSPEYISFSRGNTTIGTGHINGFVCVSEDAFNMDVYTELYVSVKGAENAVEFTKEYDDIIENAKEEIEGIRSVREQERHDEIVDEANRELSKARAEFEDEKNKAKNELDKAYDEIESGQSQINDGLRELKDGEYQLNSNKVMLQDKKNQINDGLKELVGKEGELSLGEKEIAKAKEQLKDGRNQYEEGIVALAKGKAEFDAGKKEYEEAKIQVDEGRIEIEKAKQVIADSEANLDAYEIEIKQLEEEIKTNPSPEKIEKIAQLRLAIILGRPVLEKSKEKLATQEAKVIEAEAQLADAKQKLDEAEADINANQALLDDTKITLDEAEKAIAKNEEDIKSGRAQIGSAKCDLKIGSLQVESGLSAIDSKQKELDKAKEGIDLAQKDLDKGIAEYNDAKEEVDKELSDAEKKLREAEDEIEKIENAKWYINDRTDLPEHSTYGENADRMKAIGKVFPVLFFLVAALISLTTMTRMVEDERVQIGTLKALGYSRRSIAGKYLGYAGLATLGGSIVGILIGEKILPFIIIFAYGIMFPYVHEIIIPYNMYYGLIAGAAAFGCTMLATYFSCNKEMKEQAAQLMRPPSPKQGKRVFMERITFIWKHLSFIWKATVRNLIRYKKRFFMTVFGIGGCMALLLVGFGLKDSITNIAVLQYNEIQLYDATVILESDATKAEKKEIREALEKDNRVDETIDNLLVNVTLKNDKIKREAYLNVPSNVDEFKDFAVFKDRVTDEEFNLNDEGVILTEKTATMLDVDAGDIITIKDDIKGEIEVKVSAVCENYLGHFMYMTPGLYEKLYGKELECNSIYYKMKEDMKSETESVGESVLTRDGALSISYTDSLRGQIDNMLGSLDIVIVVLVISAGMLAFVVLYNLNNINITERQRELATLKVLGFYDNEVAAYVYRENIILSVIGALFGCILGKLLHGFVIQTVEVESAMFGRNIDFSSFIYGFIITMGFSLFVNLVMYFKLKKIDMVESLKSVE